MRAHGRCVLPEAQASKGTLSPSGRLAHPAQDLGPLLYLRNRIKREAIPDTGNPRMLPSTGLSLPGVGQIWMAGAGHFCQALKQLANGGVEICGFLIDNGYFIEMIGLRNKSKEPGTFFVYLAEADAIEKACKELNHEIVGTYQSHPFFTAEPGASDLARAFDNEILLIIDVHKRDAKLWRVSNKKKRELSFSLLECTRPANTRRRAGSSRDTGAFAPNRPIILWRTSYSPHSGGSHCRCPAPSSWRP